MTTSNMHQAEMPSYLSQFQCIGSKCPETCCAGWQVDIDKNTYKKLRALPKNNISERINKYVEKHSVNSSGKRFAYIKMSEANTCPMLDEDMLCGVQKSLGSEYLSVTCKDYPRQYTAWGIDTQVIATLSCPEAARLCLTDEKIWKIEKQQLSIPIGKKISHIAGTSGNLITSPNLIHRKHKEIRDFSIKVLQDRSVEMWQRLLLIGLTCDRIDALACKELQPNSENELEGLLLQARLAMLDGSFVEQTKGLASGQNAIIAKQIFIKMMTDIRMLMAIQGTEIVINRAFSECITDVFTGLDYRDEDHKGNADRLGVATDAFHKFEEEHPNFLENLLCNTVAIDVFPIGKLNKKTTDQWVNILIYYSMIRFYLIGMQAFYREEFNMEHCIKLVYSFAKTIHHNSQFLNLVHDKLEKEKLNSLATMAILIKD
jgi:lysine-N-methylase